MPDWTLNHCTPFQIYFKQPGEDVSLLHFSLTSFATESIHSSHGTSNGKLSLATDMSGPRGATSIVKSYAVSLDRTGALFLFLVGVLPQRFTAFEWHMHGIHYRQTKNSPLFAVPQCSRCFFMTEIIWTAGVWTNAPVSYSSWPCLSLCSLQKSSAGHRVCGISALHALMSRVWGKHPQWRGSNPHAMLQRKQRCCRPCQAALGLPAVDVCLMTSFRTLGLW